MENKKNRLTKHSAKSHGNVKHLYLDVGRCKRFSARMNRCEITTHMYIWGGNCCHSNATRTSSLAVFRNRFREFFSSHTLTSLCKIYIKLDRPPQNDRRHRHCDLTDGGEGYPSQSGHLFLHVRSNVGTVNKIWNDSNNATAPFTSTKLSKSPAHICRQPHVVHSFPVEPSSVLIICRSSHAVNVFVL